MSIFSVSISGELENRQTGEIIFNVEHETPDISFLNIRQDNETIRIDSKDLIAAIKILGLVR